MQAADADEATTDLATVAGADEDEDPQVCLILWLMADFPHEYPRLTCLMYLSLRSSIPITAPTAQSSASIFIPPQIQGSWAEHMQSEAATNTSVNTQLTDTGTIEELTASQFRTVFDYIREPNQTRMQDHEAATQIIRTLRIMLNAATETTHSFHNLAVLLGRGSPLRYPYMVLMSWIQELTYQITSTVPPRRILSHSGKPSQPSGTTSISAVLP
ncbi:unnamed protein product [Heligmosomoides polygyrus]|uniref:UBC core domain-containing protein n=1 Tax=Heligmosomoides polygyrus TaxID=6339 RepID=A0A183GNL1_HELPZ|nr:unnamed protein product [Heligmosomoides polygyrus]